MSHKGQSWNYEAVVGSTLANIVARVIRKKVIEPTFALNNISISEQTEVKVNAHVNRSR